MSKATEPPSSDSAVSGAAVPQAGPTSSRPPATPSPAITLPISVDGRSSQHRSENQRDFVEQSGIEPLAS